MADDSRASNLRGGRGRGGGRPLPKDISAYRGGGGGGGGDEHFDDSESSAATWQNKVSGMTEAQILQTMVSERSNAYVQFLGIKELVNVVWPKIKNMWHKRTHDGQSTGTSANPLCPWSDVFGAVVGAMEAHAADVSVTENSCVALFYYTEHMLKCDSVSLQGPPPVLLRAIHVLVDSLRREKETMKHGVDTAAMMALMNFSEAHRSNLRTIVTAGGVDVLQSAVYRHRSSVQVTYVAYKLLSIITALYPLELSISSAMSETLRRGFTDQNVCGTVLTTMLYITNAPPAGTYAPDAARIEAHMKSNINSILPGLCWVLAATQYHQGVKPMLVLSFKLLSNVATNAESNDMAKCIIESLGFSAVLDGMNRFRVDYDVQLQGAKAMWAILRFGGIEEIEQNVRQSALQVLNAVEIRFILDEQRELRTFANNARVLIQPEPIEVGE